jgi:predicted MPP superfamily phosphohydrolase
MLRPPDSIDAMRVPVWSSLPEAVRRLSAAIAAAGALCVAYGVLVERRWFRVQRYTVPVLPDGAHPLTVLHLSDLHLRRANRAELRFLRSLEPADLTVLTGDLVGEPEAVETVVEALKPLRGRLGSCFVLGSNDYFAPRVPRYYDYAIGGRSRGRPARPGRGRDLVRQLEDDGWVHLRNARTQLDAAGTRFEVVGMDDPHVYRHDIRVAGREDPEAVGLAVVHSPDPAPELAALGYRLILAGHTHGGQVRFPLIGAVLTNSHMPNRLAAGLVRLPPAMVHISPGMGTGKYAPFRFLCRPEATVLELVPSVIASLNGHGPAVGQPVEAANAGSPGVP